MLHAFRMGHMLSSKSFPSRFIRTKSKLGAFSRPNHYNRIPPTIAFLYMTFSLFRKTRTKSLSSCLYSVYTHRRGLALLGSRWSAFDSYSMSVYSTIWCTSLTSEQGLQFMHKHRVAHRYVPSHPIHYNLTLPKGTA